MQTTGQIALDPRLSMIVRLVGSCERCADIGCDHGRLGAFLLQADRCKSVVLTDVSAPSLNKARRLIRDLGLEDRAEFAVGSGALALDAPVDCAVIAGMGGATIAAILREGRDGRRNYVVICARPGSASYDERQRIVGPVLLERRPEELTPYAQFRLRVAKKALAGAQSAADRAQAEPLEREIAIWEEVLTCPRQ